MYSCSQIFCLSLPQCILFCILGVNQASTNSLPVYFRLKSNRTASGRKCRKPRTVFTELQLMILEREFSEHKYLSTPQRTKLADRLGLNQTQVRLDKLK